MKWELAVEEIMYKKDKNRKIFIKQKYKRDCKQKEYTYLQAIDISIKVNAFWKSNNAKNNKMFGGGGRLDTTLPYGVVYEWKYINFKIGCRRNAGQMVMWVIFSENLP